jgi:DNA (cytosine-5)-methyltransferase 1
MNKISIFSFFSGSGLLDLGFEKSGYHISFVNEYFKPFLDAYKYSRKTMKIDEPEYGYSNESITEFLNGKRSNFLKEVVNNKQKDGLVGFIGGPPCPDFSVGGKNKGKYGDNGKLSGIYVNLINNCKPDFFLFENVKGLWRTQKHRTFYEELKNNLQGNGFVTTERLINSIEYGAPQDRDRIILIGFQGKILKNFYSEDLFSCSVPKEEFPWKKFMNYNKENIFSLSWPKQEEFLEESEKKPPENVPDNLTVQHWFIKNDVQNHANSQHFFKPHAGLARFKTVDEGDDSKKSFKRLHRYRYSPTACYGNNEVHLHPYKARRISVSEALAIQSLPRDFILPDDMSLTNMFKTIGNGVPFLAAKGLAKTIKYFLENKE